jgi:hypothetical protein
LEAFSPASGTINAMVAHRPSTQAANNVKNSILSKYVGKINNHLDRRLMPETEN